MNTEQWGGARPLQEGVAEYDWTQIYITPPTSTSPTPARVGKNYLDYGSGWIRVNFVRTGIRMKNKQLWIRLSVVFGSLMEKKVKTEIF